MKHTQFRRTVCSLFQPLQRKQKTRTRAIVAPDVVGCVPSLSYVVVVRALREDLLKCSRDGRVALSISKKLITSRLCGSLFPRVLLRFIGSVTRHVCTRRRRKQSSVLRTRVSGVGAPKFLALCSEDPVVLLGSALSATFD